MDFVRADRRGRRAVGATEGRSGPRRRRLIFTIKIATLLSNYRSRKIAHTRASHAVIMVPQTITCGSSEIHLVRAMRWKEIATILSGDIWCLRGPLSASRNEARNSASHSPHREIAATAFELGIELFEDNCFFMTSGSGGAERNHKTSQMRISKGHKGHSDMMYGDRAYDPCTSVTSKLS